jgi:sugar O-acyltransferase (sialic acid O-acetyltransferase NeuD family)
VAEPLVIIGAGGFGREVFGLVAAINQAAPEPVWDCLGFLDDGKVRLDRLERIGARLLGTTEQLPDFPGVRYVVGIGEPRVRTRLAGAADAAGLRAATLIHPAATIGLEVEIGEGSIICSHVSITTNVRIMRHVHLDQNVAVGHDVVMEDFVRVNPAATVSGDVVIEEAAIIGAHSVVIQGLRVGVGSVVGAGAAVIHDISALAKVAGVPAVVIGRRDT